MITADTLKPPANALSKTRFYREIKRRHDSLPTGIRASIERDRTVRGRFMLECGHRLPDDVDLSSILTLVECPECKRISGVHA